MSKHACLHLTSCPESSVPHAPAARDAEYTNGTSFYFDRQQGTCRRVAFPVGILTPDWLANATYLGTEVVDAAPCHVWTKSDGFIKYWADQRTGIPVRWIFFTGMQASPPFPLPNNASDRHPGMLIRVADVQASDPIFSDSMSQLSATCLVFSAGTLEPCSMHGSVWLAAEVTSAPCKAHIKP